MVKTWYDKDLSFDAIKDEKIAVIGYGSQGQAQASNLRDSGLNVVVGLRAKGKSWKKAVKEKHKVMKISDAVKKSDIIHILIPDTVQESVYKTEIKPYLKKGMTIGFSHGAAIHFGWIKPPKWVDVIMIAPKSPGQRVRELFKEGFGTPAVVAVKRDYSKKAWSKILSIAKGTGCARAGILKTTFKEEVETDLFGEQVDLCGGADRLIRNSFEVLIENGYQPEIAYFECLHELKLIVDLIQRYGIGGMYKRVSETARYGGLTRGGVILNQSTKKSMLKNLKDIQSGKFAKEWRSIYNKEGPKSFNKYMAELEKHPIEKVGVKLRRMMWPNEEVT